MDKASRPLTGSQGYLDSRVKQREDGGRQREKERESRPGTDGDVGGVVWSGVEWSAVGTQNRTG